jgi:hypothetical protein
MIFQEVISEELCKMISKETNLVWDDVSYINDDTDSILNEELGVIVFLPNMTEYMYFYVVNSEDYGSDRDGLFFENLNDLVKHLNELKEN